MNYYKDSNGNRYTQKEVECKIRQAEKQKLEKHFEDHGYFFCEICHENKPEKISISHIISVKWAKENGQTELCWSLENMQLAHISCHQEFDNQPTSERIKKA